MLYVLTNVLVYVLTYALTTRINERIVIRMHNAFIYTINICCGSLFSERNLNRLLTITIIFFEKGNENDLLSLVYNFLHSYIGIKLRYV